MGDLLGICALSHIGDGLFLSAQANNFLNSRRFQFHGECLPAHEIDQLYMVKRALYSRDKKTKPIWANNLARSSPYR